MSNVFIHHRNENQKYLEMLSYSHQNDYTQKKKKKLPKQQILLRIGMVREKLLDKKLTEGLFWFIFCFLFFKTFISLSPKGNLWK